MEIIYHDDRVCVCVKPPRVNSTDIPGGLPQLVRDELGGNAYTVHRLDAAVSGLMVLARTHRAAGDLSAQIRQGDFAKDYLAVVQGILPEKEGQLRDLLLRDKARRMTFVAPAPGKDVQEAILRYRVLAEHEGMSLVAIHLITGRTHQIRCQFSSRGWPLVADRKYNPAPGEGDIALWSCRLRFCHPRTGEKMEFYKLPPDKWPWKLFEYEKEDAF